MVDYAQHLVDCVASLISLCSCVSLIWRLCRLAPTVRCRLFPRQALWLGLADAAYTVAKVAIEHGRLVLGVDLCRHVWLIMLTTNISYLMETFLCLGFALKAAKLSRCLRLLRYSGVASLILGGLLVLAEPRWNYVGIGDRLVCQLRDAHTMDVAFVALTSACLVISFGGFLFVLTERHASSDAVNRKIVVQSAAYMVKAVIIVVPVVISLALYHGLGPTPAVLSFYSLANTLQDLNGAANASTYFLLSRYSRRRMLDTCSVVEQSRGESFQVAFNDEICVRVFSKASTQTPTPSTNQDSLNAY